MDKPAITELIDRLRAGDLDARADLFVYVSERFYPLAHKLLRVDFPRAGLYAETSDILNETLCKLIPYLERAETAKCTSEEQFYGLASLVIRRTLLDVARRFFGKFQFHQWSEGLEASHPKLVESSGLNAWRDRSRIHELIERLDPQLRQVLEMKIYLGFDGQETAGRLGLHPGSVSRRMSLAKEALGRLLRDDEERSRGD